MMTMPNFTKIICVIFTTLCVINIITAIMLAVTSDMPLIPTMLNSVIPSGAAVICLLLRCMYWHDYRYGFLAAPFLLMFILALFHVGSYVFIIAYNVCFIYIFMTTDIKHA